MQHCNSSGNPVFLNDLWEYSAGQWKWVSGSNLVNASGSYGTKGIAAPGNVAGGPLRRRQLDRLVGQPVAIWRRWI
jgi:hypothetical protein